MRVWQGHAGIQLKRKVQMSAVVQDSNEDNTLSEPTSIWETLNVGYALPWLHSLPSDMCTALEDSDVCSGRYTARGVSPEYAHISGGPCIHTATEVWTG